MRLRDCLPRWHRLVSQAAGEMSLCISTERGMSAAQLGRHARHLHAIAREMEALASGNNISPRVGLKTEN